MGASVLRRKIRAAGFPDVTVTNKAIANLTDDVDVVISHQDLIERARQRTPSAIHVSVEDFMASPRYDEVVGLLQRTNQDGAASAIEAEQEATAPPAAADGAPSVDGAPSADSATATGTTLLATESIILAGTATDRDGAIVEAGQLLVAAGAVSEPYIESMLERERSISTHVGNGLAIPHGTNEGKKLIGRTGISFVRYPEGIAWEDGKVAEFVVGIAGAGNDHLQVLAKIAEIFLDPVQVDQLRAARSPDEVQALLSSVDA